jgi:hypothetical protein
MAVVYGLLGAYEKRWFCDDIFVTFRYVRNWLAGDGIVYNVGERVEGYTHVLWMCLIAIFQKLGVAPETSTHLLSLSAFAGTILAAAWISWTAVESAGARIPLAAILLALHYDFSIWGTSGLETSSFTFLIILSVWTLCLWRTTERNRLLVTGMLLTGAVLLRPDGVLIYACAGSITLLRAWTEHGDRRALIRAVLLLSVPFVVLYLPYLAWRYSYYGALLPNTYYAKSGGGSYWDQGFTYLWVYLEAYWSSWIALAGVATLTVVLARGASSRERSLDLLSDRRAGVIAYALLVIVVYGILFVARVGGDFMYARFLHPLIPLGYLAGELSFGFLARGRKWIPLAAAALCLLLVLTDRGRRDRLFINEDGTRKPAFQLSGIADEYWFWGETTTAGVTPIVVYEMTGNELERMFSGEHVRVLLKAQLSLGYYGRFDECIESTGLTDAYIAHLPLEHRGRPGHEHEAPLRYLEERKVHFIFFTPPYDSAPYRQIRFHTAIGDAPAEMLTYDAPMMERLHARYPSQIEFTDFRSYLDAYCRSLQEKPTEVVAKDFEKFRRYYFASNADSVREQRFRQRLGRRE